MTTKTVLEKELKISIDDEAIWCNLREVLGGAQSRVLNQINTYFDTADRTLLAAGDMMVRVRQENEAIEVTVKDRIVIDSSTASLQTRERTASLSAAQWRQVHRGECDLTALDVDLCRILRDEAGGSLFPIGSIVNTRFTYELEDGYIAELDRTEFPGGRIDFEVEVELRLPHHSFEGAKRALAAPLEIAGVEMIVPSSPKYQRFLACLAAPDPMDGDPE